MMESGSREFMADIVKGRHPNVVHIFRYFSWSHLPEDLQVVSRAVALLAVKLVEELPDSPELVAGLRKLLEAKDCFVRTALDGVGE
jgi:hypothetical protein